MLEFMLSNGGGQYFPDSGPGPKSLLKGTTEYGYFGTVTQDELFTPAELITAAGVTGTQTANANMLWVKFFYQGRVIYYPTQSFMLASWVALYNAGVAYGPDKDIYGSVEQNKLVSKFEDGVENIMWLRLPTINDADPIPTTVVVPGPQFTELLPKVFKSGSVRFATGVWDQLQAPIVVWPSYINTRNTVTAYPGSHLINDVGALVYTANTLAVGWAPILELIDLSETVINIENVSIGLSGNRPADIIQTKQSQPGFTSISDITVSLITDTQPVTTVGINDPVFNVTALTTKLTNVVPANGYGVFTNVINSTSGLSVSEHPIPISSIKSTLN